ncbi:DJ-1 family glyoxalase III [Campylobacter sp. 19-13652]|uniref:DJ-1 family glyoxalase III n=1 Tax=Campylobacter sp. 19-13652 TaxID=2840180 RepID=UPI001C793EBA|nr:DJ-1 family glyoxalase III [Campylobacter sp. 19-13652]BCX78967.1 4-methyl-5(B-hydroxyethyl)-thiazole monophosphate biosynthesis protein [Campylobacter sp. 19-13652]
MKVAVILAEGFEEIEAISCVDVLRRAGIEVSVAGLASAEVSGAHGVRVVADTTLGELRAEDLSAVVLPGGLPGAEHLANSSALKSLLVKMKNAGKIVAAICAAPMALEAAGVLSESFVCYPGFEENVRASASGYVPNCDVLVSNGVITGKGPALSMKFALEIVCALKGDECAREVAAGLLFA